jgi:hypothetical protein
MDQSAVDRAIRAAKTAALQELVNSRANIFEKNKH